jgi:Ca2+-binding RTX toxin-like protein
VDRRLPVVVLLSVLVLLSAPGLARAATTVGVVHTGGLDIVVADDSESSSTINTYLDQSSGPNLQVQNPAGATPGNECQAIDGTGGTYVACPGTFDAVIVYGNGGNDTITLGLTDKTGVEPALPAIHGEAYGDAGNDTLKASPDFRDIAQPETYMEGGEGNDTLVSGNGTDELHGGNGNDTMQSFEGEDVVRGEGGDDSVSAGKEEPDANAADIVDGGPGFDQIPAVDADYSRGSDDDVSVTNDGVANDGEAGEGDNVLSVEKLFIFAKDATAVGTAGNDDIFVDADSSLIRGLGGNDKLVAYDGNDVIEGGDGDDFLEGGFGNDVLDGGAGVDQFNGDRTEANVIAIGNDQIRARDGNAEQVSCGIGSDSAQVDASDVVDATCETVDRGPVIVDGHPPAKPGKPKLLTKLSVKAIAKKGLVLRIACPAACAVTAELRVDKKTARKLKLGKSRVLARGKKKLAGAGNARVTLKVVRKARKPFKKLRRAKVTLKTATKVGGVTTRTSRVLKLKR